MVLPLLALGLMAAGGGAQMLGQQQQKDAQRLARNKYGFASQFANEGNQRDNAWAGQGLTNLGQQWNTSNDQAVEDNSAANMRGNFGSGSEDLQRSIANLLASTPQAGQDQLRGAAENVAFQNALQRQSTNNDIRTEGLRNVLANNAGLDRMSQGYSDAMSRKDDRDMMIRNRINAILKLQNYSQAVRNAALQRAGAELGLDQARAASTGSGAMYLGSLLGAGGGLLGGLGGTTNAGGTGGLGNAGFTDIRTPPNAV